MTRALPPQKLTRQQREALICIRDRRNPFNSLRSNAGGARYRMVERLRRAGYWKYGEGEDGRVLTDAGRAAIGVCDCDGGQGSLRHHHTCPAFKRSGSELKSARP